MHGLCWERQLEISTNDGIREYAASQRVETIAVFAAANGWHHARPPIRVGFEKLGISQKYSHRAFLSGWRYRGQLRWLA